MVRLDFNIDWGFTAEVCIRCLLAVVIGCIIGSERARHGRSAGMRTHTLVCLGATLTSLTGIFAVQFLGNNGDILRLSAQVVSGIGFLGAGMIIVKSNNIISGLTTAAGVWATGIIGIALGCGFYVGAITSTALLLMAIIIISKFEKRKKNTENFYIEIDDMKKANITVDTISKFTQKKFSYTMVAPKSGCIGHLGINITMERATNFDFDKLLEIDNIVYYEDD